MTQDEYTQMKKHLQVLKEVAEQYAGRSIDNIIMQLEARIKHHEAK